MLKLRHQIAVQAGCKNYMDYQFIAKHRFDYTPQECKRYHETVEKVVVPLWSNILKSRCRQMRLTTLRPWDLSVDPLGRQPLKPFENVYDLITGVQEMFNRTDEELGAQFREMVELRLLDLESRKGKAPGGYQSTLAEARKPFIFMNAVGVDDDVNTLLHEGGHAFHAFSCAQESLYDYRHGPMEFNEVASMGMELLAGEHIFVFYQDGDRNRSRQSHFEDIIHVLVWVAIIDSFQHWIYENPQYSRQERTRVWLNICKRFGGDWVDWQGL